MSFYSDASLVMIPSGYKNGKVYSAVPTDGTGDLTFTRASNATRVASNGLIEEVRTNEIRNSTMVGASAPSTLPTNWVLTTAGLTFTVIGTGTEDGFTYIEVNATGTASSSNARIGFDSATQILGATGQYWTNSFYFKKVSETAAPDSYAMAIFENTSAGSLVILNVVNFTPTTTLARYTYSVLTSGGATVARVQPFVRFSLTLGNSYNFTFRIAAPQMELGDIATDYIATTTAAVSVGPVSGLPRLDYLNSSCPRLLLEPQRTNLLTYSEQFDNAYWTKDATTATANAAISPDGYTNADKIFETATTDFHRIYGPTISVTSGTAYTASIFVKAAEVTTFAIEMRLTSNVEDSTFNLVTGTATGNGIIQDYGNGWYRCILTGTATATGGGRPMFFLKQRSSYAGNASNGILIYGAQFEAGAYATSYIPTLAASVTRVADACSKTGISSLIGQTEGTLYWEGEIKLGEQSRLVFCSDGSLSNFINTLVSTTGEISAAIRASLVTSTAFTSSTLTAGVHKIAFAYKANDSALYIDGVSISGTSGATVPATSRLDIGSRLGSDSFLNSGTSQALLFKTRLTNAQCQELTSL